MSINHPALDSQHRTLVSIINWMVDALQSEHPELAAMLEGQLFSFEKLFTEHLQREEIILKRINHPELDEIIQINRAFEKNLNNLNQAWKEKELTDEEIIAWLMGSFKEHLAFEEVHINLLESHVPPQQ